MVYIHILGTLPGSDGLEEGGLDAGGEKLAGLPVGFDVRIGIQYLISRLREYLHYF